MAEVTRARARSYIAVVKQLGCYNVFIVRPNSTTRLLQSTGAECGAFAAGYAAGWNALAEERVVVKYFECDAGDAGELPWRGAL